MGINITGLDGKQYKWKPESYNDQRENSSSLHVKARELIHSLFPFYAINEEVQLVGVPTKLYIDMYIHPLRLAVEIHGSQHYKFNSFFFSSAKDFRESKRRDVMKIDWCRLNNIDLVELPYNEDLDQWTERIKNRGTHDGGK